MSVLDESTIPEEQVYFAADAAFRRDRTPEHAIAAATTATIAAEALIATGTSPAIYSAGQYARRVSGSLGGQYLPWAPGRDHGGLLARANAVIARSDAEHRRIIEERDALYARYWQALAGVPNVLPRADYEAHAARLGVSTVLEDAAAAGISRDADFVPTLDGSVSMDHALWATLAQRRRYAIDAEKRTRTEAETLAGPQVEEAGYQQTKAILGALERGMPVEEIEAALEGRPHKPGRQVERCPRCGTTGYSGEYPFSTGYSSLCDDCGG